MGVWVIVDSERKKPLPPRDMKELILTTSWAASSQPVRRLSSAKRRTATERGRGRPIEWKPEQLREASRLYGELKSWGKVSIKMGGKGTKPEADKLRLAVTYDEMKREKDDFSLKAAKTLTRSGEALR